MRRRPADHRPAHRQHPGVPARRPPPAGARGRAGRALHRRRRPGSRLPRPSGADGRALRPRPLQHRARCPPVPHRGPGPLPARRQPRVPGPARLPGEGAWLPHRAGRDRGGAGPAPRGARGRGAGPRGQARRQAAGGLRRRRGTAARPPPASCARFLSSGCPSYMVPSAFVLLEPLPLTPNGKVDRKALPAPDCRTPTPATFVAPRTPTEQALAGLWRQLLGLERVGVHDNFFALGGHSLLATRLASRLRSTFQVELPLRELFEAPTLSSLASRIDAARGASPHSGPPLVPQPREGALPLSFAQQRLWFLDQLQPGSPLYNIPAAVLLEGPLDVRRAGGAASTSSCAATSRCAPSSATREGAARPGHPPPRAAASGPGGPARPARVRARGGGPPSGAGGRAALLRPRRGPPACAPAAAAAGTDTGTCWC